MSWTTKIFGIESFGIAGLLIASMLFATSSADAAAIAWYRMGDDDGSLTTPPVDGAPIDLVEGTRNTKSSSAGPLIPITGVPDYTTVTPGPFVYNPQRDIVYNNGWAMETDASENRERARAAFVVPSEFSYEVFARFPNVTASAGQEFAYHRNNTNGGWQLEINADDTVELNVNSKIDGGGVHILDLDSTAKLVDGQWHHIGVIFEGNSQDGSDDAHLYIDYQLDVSGNVPDTNTFGGDAISFYNGSVLTQDASLLDESRYFDEVLPLDGSGFLTATPEPGSAVLVGIGLIAVVGCARRKK